MKQGNYKGAYESLLDLRNTPFQAARDFWDIHARLHDEDSLPVPNRDEDGHATCSRATKINIFKRFVQLFLVARVRRAALASGIAMVAQQMCGSAWHIQTCFDC